MWRKDYSNEAPKNSWQPEQVKEKMMAYCAYQERCIWEAKRKMFEKKVDEDVQEEVIRYLLDEKFIDEERFAKAFCRGKFNMKKWGRKRLSMELKMRKIPEDLIRKGLAEIDPYAYYDTLLAELEKRWEREKENDSKKKKYKVTQYLMSRGFEYDLIRDAIEEFGVS